MSLASSSTTLDPYGNRAHTTAGGGPLKKFRYFALLLLLSLLGFALLAFAYGAAKNEAEERLFSLERLLSDQAATGIESYFFRLERAAVFLSLLPGVAEEGLSGREFVRTFYEAYRGDLTGVTRVDSRGRILYSYPDESVSGRDISAQEHVARLLSSREAVLSGVFDAVQGYRAVALHIPVRQEGRFTGSIALLIPFESLTRLFLDGIGIGESGHAFLVDGAGVELFGPIPERVGSSLYGASSASPSLLALVDQMRSGASGRARLKRDKALYPKLPGNHMTKGQPVDGLAYFRAINYGGTHWSISVMADESEAVAFIKGFRDRWTLAMAGLLLILALWSILFVRALFKARRLAELERQGAERMATLARLVAGLSHQLNSPLGALIAADEVLGRILGSELAGILRYNAGLSAERREDFARLLELAAPRLLSARLQSPAELRSASRKARDYLEKAGLPDAGPLVDDLADLGLVEEVELFAPLAAEPGGALLFSSLHSLADSLSSVRIIGEAARKAAEAIALLEIYIAGPKAPLQEAWDSGPRLRAFLERQTSAARRGIVLEMEIEEGLFLRIEPESLERVWSCIVSNALQAMGLKGKLQVQARREASDILMTFTDSGPGIPSAIAPRIFEPFFTTKGPGEGSGLGLDIAKRITEAAEGSISFESRPGHTTFFLRFPSGAL